LVISAQFTVQVGVAVSNREKFSKPRFSDYYVIDVGSLLSKRFQFTLN